MKDITRNYLNMGRRVSDFTVAYVASFLAGSRGSVLATAISTTVLELEALGAKQDAAMLDGQLATDQKDAALLTLMNLLRAINRTARGMERLFPGIGGRFRMPRGSNQSIINRARAILEEATPMAADFTGRGLPANFLTTLEAAIVAFEAAIDRQNAALAAQTNATAALAAAQRKLTADVRELSPIVRNVFRDDPAILAEWQSASRVERAPKKAKPSPPKP